MSTYTEAQRKLNNLAASTPALCYQDGKPIPLGDMVIAGSKSGSMAFYINYNDFYSLGGNYYNESSLLPENSVITTICMWIETPFKNTDYPDTTYDLRLSYRDIKTRTGPAQAMLQTDGGTMSSTVVVSHMFTETTTPSLLFTPKIIGRYMAVAVSLSNAAGSPALPTSGRACLYVQYITV